MDLRVLDKAPNNNLGSDINKNIVFHQTELHSVLFSVYFFFQYWQRLLNAAFAQKMLTSHLQQQSWFQNGKQMTSRPFYLSAMHLKEKWGTHYLFAPAILTPVTVTDLDRTYGQLKFCVASGSTTVLSCLASLTCKHLYNIPLGSRTVLLALVLSAQISSVCYFSMAKFPELQHTILKSNAC